MHQCVLVQSNSPLFPTHFSFKLLLFFRRRQYRKGKGARGRWDKPEAEVASPVPFKNYNSEVKLFASRCQLRKTTRTKAQISKYHILENGKTGQQICHNILDTNIGVDQCCTNMDINNVIVELSPILELFRKRHNRFNYIDKLKSVVARGGQRYANLKYKNQIHLRAMQAFFKMLFYEVIPAGLFGSTQNMKALRDAINCLLRTVPRMMIIKGAYRRTMNKKNRNAIGASLNMQSHLKRLAVCSSADKKT